MPCKFSLVKSYKENLPSLDAKEGSAVFNLESKDNYSDSLERVLSDGGGILPRDLEVIATSPLAFLNSSNS
jgi:hypothetical protein